MVEESTCLWVVPLKEKMAPLLKPSTETCHPGEGQSCLLTEIRSLLICYLRASDSLGPPTLPPSPKIPSARGPLLQQCPSDHLPHHLPGFMNSILFDLLLIFKRHFPSLVLYLPPAPVMEIDSHLVYPQDDCAVVKCELRS